MDARAWQMMAVIWAFCGMLLAALFVLDRAAPAGRGVIKVTGTDAVSYYATARSLLFDRDFDLANEYEHLHPMADRWTGIVPATGRRGSPFAIGLSLFEIPFIGAGWALGGGGDGYGKACMTAYFVGFFAFLAIGLSFLFLFLRALGDPLGAARRRSDWVAFVVTLGLWPLTNLSYYTFAPMAHIASFAACAVFLFSWWRVRDANDVRGWVLVGISLGLLFLCRWQAVLFGAIPVLWELPLLRRTLAGSDRMRWLFARAIAIAAFAACTVPQLCEWKAIYGHWLTMPQGGSFMQFPPRHLPHVLFSTNHGWFVWTPFTAVGVIGLLAAVRTHARIAVPFLVAIALQVIVIGSLIEDWNSNESFGNRMLMECLPLVGVGLVWLLGRGAPVLDRTVAVAAVSCTIWTFVFAVEFRLDLVPKNDALTAAELFACKLRVRDALARHQLAAKAQQALDAGDSSRALAIIASSASVDRVLLKLEIRAHDMAGDPTGRAAAQSRLDALLATRLF